MWLEWAKVKMTVTAKSNVCRMLRQTTKGFCCLFKTLLPTDSRVKKAHSKKSWDSNQDDNNEWEKSNKYGKLKKKKVQMVISVDFICCHLGLHELVGHLKRSKYLAAKGIFSNLYIDGLDYQKMYFLMILIAQGEEMMLLDSWRSVEFQWQKLH